MRTLRRSPLFVVVHNGTLTFWGVFMAIVLVFFNQMYESLDDCCRRPGCSFESTLRERSRVKVVRIKGATFHIVADCKSIPAQTKASSLDFFSYDPSKIKLDALRRSEKLYLENMLQSVPGCYIEIP